MFLGDELLIRPWICGLSIVSLLVAVSRRSLALSPSTGSLRIRAVVRHAMGPALQVPARASFGIGSLRRHLEGVVTVDGQSREPVSFLVFSASLREGSLNTQLAELAAAVIETNGGTVDLALMADFDCPSYSADVQRDDRLSDRRGGVARRLDASDAFVICSPEYNASLPGGLKNSSTGSRAPSAAVSRAAGLSCRHRRRWSAVTAASGLCACPSSISAPVSSRTCSRSPRPITPSTATGTR